MKSKIMKKFLIFLILSASILSCTVVHAKSPAVPSKNPESEKVVWITDTDLQNSEQLSKAIEMLGKTSYGYALPAIEFVFCENDKLAEFVQKAQEQNTKIGAITTHSKEACESVLDETSISLYYDLNDKASLKEYHDFYNFSLNPSDDAIEALGNYLIYPVSEAADERCWYGTINVIMRYWKHFSDTAATFKDNLSFEERHTSVPLSASTMTITKETIESEILNPAAVVIYLDGQEIDTIPYEGEDIIINLDKKGNYRVQVLSQQMTDISSKVIYDTAASPENS